MEFDVIIGSPPYIDEETGEVIYWDFFKQAKLLNPNSIAMMSQNDNFNIYEVLRFSDYIKVIDQDKENCYFLWTKDDGN